jgi:hypothetical protein
MRWFKHMSNSRNNPKLRKIERSANLREVGIARWWKLVEMVAERAV